MVQVMLPSVLAAQADGRRRLEVEAGTLGDALRSLPIADLIFDERGDLVRHLNVYVDATDHRDQGGLDASLAEAREIRIVPMVSGG